MLPKAREKMTIAAGTACAKVRWKNTVVKCRQKVRAAGAQNLCKNMFRWASNVNFCKAVMSYNQLANELGGLETHMKPRGLWLLEEQHCYRKSLCDVSLVSPSSANFLVGRKELPFKSSVTTSYIIWITPHRKLNWQGYKVLFFLNRNLIDNQLVYSWGTTWCLDPYIYICKQRFKQTTASFILFVERLKNILFLAIWNVLYVIQYGHHAL